MEILDKNSFDEKVLKANGKVLVDFYADWCAPCKALSPIIEEVSTEFNNINFYKLNIDKTPEIATRYGIMSIPAVYIFDKGNIINKSIGLVDKDTIIKLFN